LDYYKHLVQLVNGFMHFLHFVAYSLFKEGSKYVGK